MSIEISKIRTDGGTQSRAAINAETVAEYADAMADPDTVFPPVIVYFDGKDYWLADGFHRVAAWERVGRTEVPAEIRQGDKRRAVLHSCGANAAHGLRRTNADKRRAVETLLADEEWTKWSNRKIANQCGVSDVFVGKVRGDLSANGLQIADNRTVERGGTTYEQDTANIGKARAVEQLGAEEQEKPAAPGDGAECQPDPGPAPEKDHPKLRAEFARLTDEAREDEWVNLRLSDAEQKKRIAAQRGEIADLKVRIKELSEGNQGATISKLQKRAQAAAYARDEAMTKAKRFEYRMKQAEKERDAALAELHGQEIAL